MKLLFSVFTAVLIFSACAVKHDISILKNGSGDITYTLDMSALNGMLDENPTEKTTTILEDSVMSEKLKHLEKMDGIESIKIKESEEGIYTLAYHFKSFKALNNSCSLMYSESVDKIVPFDYFTQKDKKTVIFTMPQNPVDEGNVESLSMLEGFTFDLNLTFESKIKKLETESGAVLSKDQKSITYATNLALISSPDFKPEMRIHF